MTEPIRLWVLTVEGSDRRVAMNRGKAMAFTDLGEATDALEELLPSVPMETELSTVELTEVRRCGTCAFLTKPGPDQWCKRYTMRKSSEGFCDEHKEKTP